MKSPQTSDVAVGPSKNTATTKVPERKGESVKSFESLDWKRASTWLRAVQMPERVFKLNTPTMAVRSDNEHLRIITVPADALVAIVDGDVNGSGFVKIRYGDQMLAMYAKDLRMQIEEDIIDPARFDEAG